MPEHAGCLCIHLCVYTCTHGAPKHLKKFKTEEECVCIFVCMHI